MTAGPPLFAPQPTRLSAVVPSRLSAAAASFTMPSSEDTRPRDGEELSPSRSHSKKNSRANQEASDSIPPGAPRYVPPHLREQNGVNASPPTRPVSTFSTASFATQPPLFGNTPNTAAHASSAFFHAPGHSTSYGSDNLNQRFASYNPFLDSQNSSNRGDVASRNSYNVNAPPFMFPHGSTGHSAAPSLSFGSSSMQTTQSMPMLYGTSDINTYGANASRAFQLANIVKSGATDNPLDIDFGNPGRSKRLPPEPVDAPPVMPQARGKVIVGSAKAVTLPSEANTKGNTAAYLNIREVKLPEWFDQMHMGYQPTLEQVYVALPVLEAGRVGKPSTAGVIKISGIPYSSSRSEIVAFLGRTAQINSQPEGSPYSAVHIMMDRHDGKTLDAYVEVKNAREAKMIAEQFERRIQSGRHAKLQDREVKVEAITQGDMLAEIFPHGQDLAWFEDGTPEVSDIKEEFYLGVPSAGFQGYIRQEDLHMMSKFAETPQRVSSHLTSLSAPS